MASFDPPPALPTIKTVAAQLEEVHKLAALNNGTLGDFRDALNGFERELALLRKRIPLPAADSLPPSSRGPSSNPGDVLLAGLQNLPPVTIESLAPAGYAVTPIPPRPSLAAKAAKKTVNWSQVVFTGIGAVASIVQILDWTGVLPAEQTGPLQAILAALLRLAS